MVTSLRSFLMILALSIHSIFEGMTIGLEETESGVWKLFVAISLHATAIVFCIGTEMIAMNTRIYKIVMYMVVLSIVTPIGVLIGIIVTLYTDKASGEQLLVVAVLQGLAGGTLLYITFFEVLARDKLSKYGMSGIVGALAVMVGFIAMTVIEAEAGGHSHGGNAGDAGHAHVNYEHFLAYENTGHQNAIHGDEDRDKNDSKNEENTHTHDGLLKIEQKQEVDDDSKQHEKLKHIDSTDSPKSKQNPQRDKEHAEDVSIYNKELAQKIEDNFDNIDRHDKNNEDDDKSDKNAEQTN